MPWFVVDDKLHSHRKRLRAGIDAMGLWCVAGSWSADHLTDGFIADYVARDLDPRAVSHARRLVEAGLWVAAECGGDTGWLFHDWADLQPTREQVEAKRATERDRKRRHRRTTFGQFAVSQRDTDGTDGGTPTGQDRDSQRDTNGSPPGVTPCPTQPYPALTSPKGLGSSFGGGEASVTPETRPPRTCPKHAGNPDPPPCGRCADARKAADAWSPPTLSAKVTRCGEHPEHPALHCPACDAEATPPPVNWRRA